MAKWPVAYESLSAYIYNINLNPCMEAKFSNRVKEVISLSREEALRLGHDYIGTEHLILGMIREGEGVAVGVLKKLGVPIDELRNEIEKVSKGTATHKVKCHDTFSKQNA